MSGVIETIERSQLRRVPKFQAGDRLRVHFQVVEGSRKRTQVFEGVVIKRQGSGARETFTVRKQSFGVGVERTFPVHSPKIEQIEVAARGDVRRAKLYYLRDRIGRSARVRERRFGRDDDELEGVMPPPETDAIVDAPEPEAVEADAVETEAPEATEADAPEATEEQATDEQAPEADATPEAEPVAEAEQTADETSDDADASEADGDPESGAKSDS
jgi:large subunit ribosomal protein L19